MDNHDSFKLTIKNVKNIKFFEHEFSLKSGIYVISSENGNGKSTIFSSIAQLLPDKQIFGTGLNSQSLRKKPINHQNAYIQYEYMGKIDKYIFAGGSQWTSGKKEKDRINNRCKDFNGFCELSVTYGTRFCYTKSIFENLGKSIVSATREDADTWVVEKLGFIIKNNPDFYKKDKDKSEDKDKFRLKTVGKGDINGRIGEIRKNKYKNIYAIESDKVDAIFPYEFSTGENLVLGILDFLNNLRKKETKKKALILIDEVEIGLHPTAQKNLLLVLNEIITKEQLNLCIYLSTHSPTIIANIPDRLNLMELKNNGIVARLEPNPASSILESITKDAHRDKYIFVEDDVARAYVDAVLRDMDVYEKYKIVCIGGFNNTKEAHFQLISVFGDKLITVLDGDCKDTVKKAIENDTGREVEEVFSLHKSEKDLFEVDDSFEKIKGKQKIKIKDKLDSNPNIIKLLKEYKEYLSEYDGMDRERKQERINEVKTSLKKFQNKIKEQVVDMIYAGKMEQINFLPVKNLEHFFVNDCLLDSSGSMHNYIIETLTRLSQFDSISNDEIKRILHSISNEAKSEKSDKQDIQADKIKGYFKDFCNDVKGLSKNSQFSENDFIKEILVPLIQQEYLSEVQEFKDFLRKHIKSR